MATSFKPFKTDALPQVEKSATMRAAVTPEQSAALQRALAVAAAPQAAPPSPTAGAQSAALAKFKSHAATSLVDTLNAPWGENGFHVHGLVAEHMGLGAKELAKRKLEIDREIERRWLETKEKAEVEGYTTGLNAGKREAHAAEKPRIEEKLKRLEALLQSIDTQRQRIFVDNEEFLMKLLAQVFRVIALKEIELDKDYLRRLVLTMIQQLGEKGEVALMIGELDVANIQKLREAIEHKFNDLKNLRILTNTELQPGSCRLETPTVVIDASVENQIRNAMQVLHEEKQVPK